MMRVTRAIAKKIKLHDDETDTGGISYVGETLDNFFDDAGLRYGFDISKYNAVLENVESVASPHKSTIKQSLRKQSTT